MRRRAPTATPTPMPIFWPRVRPPPPPPPASSEGVASAERSEAVADAVPEVAEAAVSVGADVGEGELESVEPPEDDAGVVLAYRVYVLSAILCFISHQCRFQSRAKWDNLHWPLVGRTAASGSSVCLSAGR